MKTFVWRHNRKHHSWSMMNEPCVHQDFYTDAVVVVQARDVDQALALLAERQEGWRIDDLKRLTPSIYDSADSVVVFCDVRGQ